MTKTIKLIGVLTMLLSACAPDSTPTSQSAPVTEEFVQPETPPTETATSTPIPSETPTFTPAPPTETFTPVPPTESFTPLPPTETSTSTPPLFVESLKARVIAEKFLSCRYGPGPEYLYLYALNKGANIELIGRTDGNNWVMVKGKDLCWVNAKFIEINGDPKTLKVMYPDGYKIPVSPYYSSPAVLSAVRDPNDRNQVTVEWADITLRAGDEEDESMFIYIIEIWRCEGGQTIFDPLASNYPEITFVDEPGCSSPSHGRVYFQEKHGYAGPAEIPWPAY
jgi:uncharacterized protein YraI